MQSPRTEGGKRQGLMPATLVIVKRDGSQKEIPLRPGVSVIGRRPDCDIRVPLAVVSRKHCRIVHQPDVTVVQDLGSINGTFVNAESVTEAAVRAGDVLTIGSVAFTVRIDGEPEQIARPEETPALASDDQSIDSADQMAPAQAAPEKPGRGAGPDSLAQLEPSADDNGLGA